MGQISVTGKENEIFFIKDNYRQLGIKRSPRMVDLAINDIKNLSNGNIDNTNYEHNVLSYEMKRYEEQFKNEVNLFEYTLKKIKTKIFNSFDEGEDHYDGFVYLLLELKQKLYSNKKIFKNFIALENEWKQIEILIDCLKSKDKGKILAWYGKYKKSNIMYEILKSEGMSNNDISDIQLFIHKKRIKKQKQIFNNITPIVE